MGADFHITVIAKEPVAGRVKTRLVPPLSFEQAAQIASACLVDTFGAVTAMVDEMADVRAVALIDGEPGEWIPDGFDVVMQRGDGLGERLANGFSDLGPGLIIGMDTPSVGQWFAEAIEALRDGDDAIGMTHDGGYWGIALAAIDPEVFEGVPMSTKGTGLAQLDQLLLLGRNVQIMPTVHDLDTFEDIAPLIAEIPGSRLASVAASLFGHSWG